MTPAGKLPQQEWLTALETCALVAALTAGGDAVRFVGGCVRDAVAGRPVKDIDLATPSPPEQVTALLERAGIKAVPTGIEHGTVTAVVDHLPFEITTLRRDLETDGRRAKVAFTDDWAADAARRDFTMNALSCAPDGTLYDPFDGLADLRAGRVRFVGDPRARIEEDYLRLLRFFRFQAHYGHEPPAPALLAVAMEMAPGLANLSGERLRQETLKLLEAPQPLPALEAMIACGVAAHYLPEVESADSLAAYLALEDADAAPDPLLRLAALLPEGGAGATVARRLRLSRAETTRLIALTAPEAKPLPDEPAALRRRRIY
ncbi:MAG: CCA tRNA nucleotidyltransferase, partial [Kiloniellales bacterium]